MNQNKIINLNRGGAPKGNQNAARSRDWSDAIRKAVIQRKVIDELANILVDKALAGDTDALIELIHRLEGSAKIEPKAYEWKE